MKRLARVELRDLHIPCVIGTYAPQDVVPDRHILDLTLTVAASLVYVSADEMAQVFDYDPLIADINRISTSQKYETQEFLMVQIAKACAIYAEIDAVEIFLRKTPVFAGSGSLGVRLTLQPDDMTIIRNNIIT
nr:dihydroneopterin aldolase [uncultured Sphingorhabdus sp.]